MAINQTQQQNIIALTVAMFDAAPGADNLSDFADFIAAGGTFEQLADNLAASAPFNSQYAGKTTVEEKLAVALDNLGLTGEARVEAQAHFETRLAEGWSTGAILLEAADYLFNNEDRLAIFDDAAALLANKVAVATYHSAEQQQTAGSLAELKAVLENVTADPASVDAAIDAIELGGRQTFTLTTGEDNLTGTAGNDVFNAPLVGTEFGIQVQTLNSSDVLDGGAGFDRLNATLNGVQGFFDGSGGEGEETAPLISNIEQLYIRSVGPATVNVLDMTGVSGAEQLWNDRSVSDLVWDNIQEEAVLGLQNVRGNTTAEFGGNGSAEQAVVSNGAGTAAAPVGLTVNNGGAGSISALNLVAAAGLTNLAAAGDLADIEELTVSGAGAVILTGADGFTEVESVDASEHTGGLDLNISGQTDGEFLNVVMGSGDDTLHIAESVLLGNDIATLDGGEGVNNLRLQLPLESSPEDWDFSDVSNFQVLTLDKPDGFDIPAPGEVTLDLSETDFTSLVANADFRGAGTLTLVGSEDFDTITMNGTAVDTTFVLEGFTDLTLNAGNTIGSAIGEDEVTLASEDLTTLTLVDTTEDGEVSVSIALGDGGDLTTENLTTIDLTGVVGGLDLQGNYEGGSVKIDASEAGFDGAVSVLVGSAELDYTAAADVREVFEFVGSDIHEVTITGFEAGSGADRDRIDLTEFGITRANAEDTISIAYDADGATISAADDQFAGTITLMGLTESDNQEIFASLVA